MRARGGERFVGALLIAMVGCASNQADSTTEPDVTSTATAEATSTTPSSTATAESTATSPTQTTTASASGTAAPFTTTKNGKRAYRFDAYDGPKAKKTFTNTPVAWVVRPAGKEGSFDEVKLGLMAFLRTTGDDVVVQYEGGELSVPMALSVAAAAPLVLKGGDVVFANTGNFGAVGKLVSLDEKRGMGKISFAMGSATETKEISRQAILKLEDKATFGRPVGFKDGSQWSAGLYAGGDANKAFVAMAKGWKVVDAKTVKPLAITGAPLAKGAKVWAATPTSSTLSPGTVDEVLDGGVRYKVKLSGGDQTVGFEFVTAPLE